MKLTSMASGLLVAASIGLTFGQACFQLQPVEARTRHTVLRGNVYSYSGNSAIDKLLTSAKYEETEKRCLSILKRRPNDVSALIGAGWAQCKLFKLDAAEANFNKALVLNSHDPMAHVGKAAVIFNRLQSSSTSVIRNKTALLQQAEAESKQGLALDGRLPESHWTMGMIYREQGRLDDAIAEFKNSTYLNRDYADGFAGLSMALLDKNDLAGAIQAANEAIAINTRESEAHYVLGEVYRRQNLFDQALKELNTALYQYRNSAPVHLSMGKALASEGNSVAAVKEFQESIRIKAENPEAYLGIADIREGRGDIELSIGELHSALELLPSNADIRLKVADQSLRVEKLDDAIKEYKVLLKTDQANAAAAKGITRAYYLKANKEATSAFFVSDEFENAKYMIDQAVALKPNDLELRLAQAKIRALSGEEVDLSKVALPTNNGERIGYAEACLAMNNFAGADEQMKTVIYSTTDVKQMFALADLALIIKDLGNAEAAYKKAETMPNGLDRATRGLTLVAKQREIARQDLTLADDLHRKGQIKSSLDKYRASIYENPRVADARLGYAIALQKDKPEKSANFKQAATQYKAYLALEKDLPAKDVDRIEHKISNLQNQAYKLAQKEKQYERGPRVY